MTSGKQKTRIKRLMRSLERPAVDLVFLLENVEDPVNVGSIFRIADACRITELVLTGISARPPHKLITKVGRGKHERVKWRYEEDAVLAVEAMQTSGYTVLALELSEGATPYHERAYPERLCIVVGHEEHGVGRRTVARSDGSIFIPMYGKGASLNVHVALGIVAFHALCARST